MEFESKWWKVMLPNGYRAEANDDCVDIIGPRETGVTQISGYRRDDRNVTLEDLLEFASDEANIDELKESVLDKFKGYAHEAIINETYWRKWWLASGRTMVYVTYQCNKDLSNVERSHVDSIIHSIRLCGTDEGHRT